MIRGLHYPPSHTFFSLLPILGLGLIHPHQVCPQFLSLLPHSLPIHCGHDLLAAAATAGSILSLLTPAGAVTAPRPFNLGASLSPKVVKRILELELLEVLEVTVDDDTPQASGYLPLSQDSPALTSLSG